MSSGSSLSVQYRTIRAHIHKHGRLPDKNILPHCLPAAVYPFNTGLSGLVFINKVVCQIKIYTVLPHCLPAAVYPFNTGLSGMVGNLLIGFSSDLLVFCERKSDSLVKKNKSIQSLFCHERPEWITHSRSFVKSHGSKMLKSLLKKERMSEERWEQFALGYKKGKT